MDKLCCIDCGTLFASTGHLQIHAKRGCPEVHARDIDQIMKICKYEQNSDNDSTDDGEEERPRERPTKCRRWITLDSNGSDQDTTDQESAPSSSDDSDQDITDQESAKSSNDESDMDEDEKGFGLLVQKAYDNYDDLYQEKQGELLETMGEAHADKEMHNMLRTKYKKNLIKQYKCFLYLTDLLKNSPTHQTIIDTINEYDQDDYDYNDIVDQAIKDKKYLFHAILDKFNESPSGT